MPEITRSGDCGNSPKNRLVEDVSVAIATADVQALLDRVTEDVIWKIVGGETSSGTDELAETVRRLGDQEMAGLDVERVCTHGKTGAVSGHVKFAKGRRDFCDVYEFSSARGTHVKAITSYRIEGR